MDPVVAKVSRWEFRGSPDYVVRPEQPSFGFSYRNTTMFMRHAPLRTAGTVPIWSLAVMAAAFPAWRSLRRQLARPSEHSQNGCSDCGYDLRATPDRCPECGHSTGTEPTNATASRLAA
jgi:hypothetical protein